MVIVEYAPANEAASATMVRTGASKYSIAQALRRALPEDFDGDVWGRQPLADETIAAIERHTGPLSLTARLCLRPLPKLVLHTKDGFVRLYLPALHSQADGERVAASFAPALRAASMGYGTWETRVRQVEPAIELSSREHVYRMARFELPVASNVDPEKDAPHWVEDELGDAIYAAMINQALWSADPEAALDELPGRRTIAVSALAGTRRERLPHPDEDGADVVIYTWLQIQTNVTVEGPVFLGHNTFSGNGLLFSESGC